MIGDKLKMALYMSDVHMVSWCAAVLYLARCAKIKHSAADLTVTGAACL